MSHPLLIFNKNVIRATSQKHLGIILDTRLSFEKHLETVLCRINNGDILYDQAHNTSFHQKIYSLQHNACLAITGVIRVTARKKLY